MKALISSLMLGVATTLGAQNSSIGGPSDATVTIHAASMIDGRGGTRRDVTITVRAGRIEKIESGKRDGGQHQEDHRRDAEKRREAQRKPSAFLCASLRLSASLR